MTRLVMFVALLTLILPAAAANALAPLFDSRVDLPVVEAPYGMTAADLDGDTDLDVVLGGIAYLVFIENQGDGDWVVRDSIPFALNCRALASGDLDGDGDYDLAVGAEHDSIYVMENLGGWSFQVSQAFVASTMEITSEVMVVDIDNDTDLDILFSYWDYVCVIRNDGSGTFGEVRRYYSRYSQGLDVADFDEDGDIDIAVANLNNNNVGIMLNDSDSTFFAPVPISYTMPWNVNVADINEDTHADLLILGYAKVSVYLGAGDGTFTFDANYAIDDENPVQAVVCDLNDDTHPDIAVLASTTSVLINDGSGGFGDADIYLTGYSPESLRALDLDDDGDLDLGHGIYSGTFGMMLNNGDGTFPVEPRMATGNYPGAVCAADFDGDGNPDIAYTGTSDDLVTVQMGNGDLTFQSPVDYPCGHSAYGLWAIDLNADSRPDLVVADSAVTVFVNSGDGTFSSGVPYHCNRISWVENGQQIDFGDLNGDTYVDVAVAADNITCILLGNGDGTLQAAVEYSLTTAAYTVDVVDMDNDGTLDLVIGDDGANFVYVALNEGNAVFGTVLNIATEEYSDVAIAEDFNDDGYPDLAVVDYYLMQVFLNNGDSTFAAPTNYRTLYGDIKAIRSDDFDDDGDNDLVVLAAEHNAVSYFENDGAGLFTHQADYGVDRYPHDLAFADFDSDGDLDLAVANYDAYTVSLLKNLTDPVMGIEEWTDGALPTSFALRQNYPNPFNPATMVEFNLSARAEVTLAIYNLLGQKVRTLIDGSQPAGIHRVPWDGRDDAGSVVATGVYFYRLRAGDETDVKKMILLK